MIGLSRITVRRLVTISAVLSLASLALMVSGLFWPSPFLLVLAMSVGQLFGTSSLALYLLAIALDLQGVGEDEAIGGGSAES